MYMCIACVYVYNVRVVPPGSQKRVLEPLTLELTDSCVLSHRSWELSPDLLQH